METNESALLCRGCWRPIVNNSKKRNDFVGSLRFSADSEQIIICNACKKFFCRSKNKIQSESCTCASLRLSSSPKSKNVMCRVCRFRRCQAAFIEKKEHLDSKISNGPVSSSGRIDFSKVPCSVCGFSSSGFHFGVVSCEGCKSFFRRTIKQTNKYHYTCKRENAGSALCSTSSNCRFCRFQRCIEAGMNLKEISIGRHTMRRRAQIDAVLQRHSNEGSFLKETIRRRKSKVSCETMVAASTTSSGGSLTYDDDAFYAPEPSVCSQQALDYNMSTYSIPSQLATAVSSPTTVPYSPYAFSESSNLERPIGESAEWYLRRAVEAAARLSSISTLRLYLTLDMTCEQVAAERMRTFDHYIKYTSDFVTMLPDISQIPIQDRIKLFTNAFFPLSVAQLSLNFSQEHQIPNHFSLDRDGPSWEIASHANKWHFEIEEFLCQAGKLMAKTIFNIQEFSLLCALLFFQPDLPRLQNTDTIQSIRRHYELSLIHYTAKSAMSEQRLSLFYRLLAFFRQAAGLFRQSLGDMCKNCPEIEKWPSLFRQFYDKYVRLPLVSSSSDHLNSNYQLHICSPAAVGLNEQKPSVIHYNDNNSNNKCYITSN